MSQVIKKSLVLGFKTSKGDTVKLTIKKPKENLDGVTINTVMERMIQSDSLGEDGKIQTKESATYVTEQFDEVKLV